MWNIALTWCVPIAFILLLMRDTSPEQRVEFNRHKQNIWQDYIEFHDRLYRCLTKLSTNSTDYELTKYNQQIYNKYLNQCLQNAKTGYYAREFTKYKGDIRKTWDTLKDILSKKSFPRICSGVTSNLIKHRSDNAVPIKDTDPTDTKSFIFPWH